MRPLLRLAAVSLLVATTACHVGSSDAEVSDAAIELGPGDIRITSTNGGFDLMLVGDEIVAGLSDSVLERVRNETQTHESGDGLGANIERFVKSTVEDALSKRVRYSVHDLRDVSYERGRIRFEYRGGDEFELLENTKTEDSHLLASFSEEDSRRFVDAVRARIE